MMLFERVLAAPDHVLDTVRCAVATDNSHPEEEKETLTMF